MQKGLQLFGGLATAALLAHEASALHERRLPNFDSDGYCLIQTGRFGKEPGSYLKSDVSFALDVALLVSKIGVTEPQTPSAEFEARFISGIRWDMNLQIYNEIHMSTHAEKTNVATGLYMNLEPWTKSLLENVGKEKEVHNLEHLLDTTSQGLNHGFTFTDMQQPPFKYATDIHQITDVVTNKHDGKFSGFIIEAVNNGEKIRLYTQDTAKVDITPVSAALTASGRGKIMLVGFRSTSACDEDATIDTIQLVYTSLDEDICSLAHSNTSTEVQPVAQAEILEADQFGPSCASHDAFVVGMPDHLTQQMHSLTRGAHDVENMLLNFNIQLVCILLILISTAVGLWGHCRQTSKMRHAYDLAKRKQELKRGHTEIQMQQHPLQQADPPVQPVPVQFAIDENSDDEAPAADAGKAEEGKKGDEGSDDDKK